MASVFSYISMLIGLSVLPLAHAGALRGQPSKDAVLQDLAEALSGSGPTPEIETRLAEMKAALEPIFKALPRSAEGLLEASAVRYLLHRYFISRHGWFVPVAGNRGEDATDMLPQVILGHTSLARTLSTRLGLRGLSLEEVAVLASAVEMLASHETSERLHAAYRIVGMSQLEDHAKESNLTEVHKAYLSMYHVGKDFKHFTKYDLNELLDDIHSFIPNWEDLLKMAREVRAEVLAGIPELRSSFSGELRFLEEYQHRYSRWNDQDCSTVKEALVQLAAPGTGRVSLPAYHNVSLPKGWEATDTTEELMEIGAVDMTDPRQPSVIIANLYDSESSCEDSSKYYSVCCISECEALLGHLERELGSPDASPHRIVELVENLPSSSVEAPRTLPAQLVQRLEQVATLHGGHTQMHGRLFRQWMHHAFPNECPFPKVSSAPKLDAPALDKVAEVEAQPRTEADSEAEAGAVDAARAEQGGAGFPAELPWHDEEELYLKCPGAGPGPGPGSTQEASSSPSWNRGHGALLLVIACCMLWRLWQMLASAAAATSHHTGLPEYAPTSKLV